MVDRLSSSSGGMHPSYGGKDFVRLQQELIAVRTRLDRQIAQLTRLNKLSNTLLSQQLGGQGLESFAETIPDVLDMAIGVVWELAGSDVLGMAAFGLDLNDPAWRQIGRDLLGQLESRERAQAVRLDPASLPLLQEQQLCDVLVCRCVNG